MLERIIEAISAKGGTVYYVGGCVRDQLLGLEPKDIDVEIHGMTSEMLIDVLGPFGQLDLIGKSFGVLRIKGLDVDFSMPRTERNTGNGHKDFAIHVDPFMSCSEACRRRDFTVNALLQNAVTGEVVDPFNGLLDLQRKVIRHIDDQTFVEDPLRVYRAVQFAARFGFEIDKATLALCSEMDLSSLPRERVFGEIQKLLLKAERPSVGFQYLLEMGIIERDYPLLHQLVGCMQQPLHHPEGDVWTHTMMVVDQAAAIRDQSGNPLALMLAALLHDVGKPAARTMIEGKLAFHGHDDLGEPMAREFLATLTEDRDLTEKTLELVRYHMRPTFLHPNGTDTTIRRLASKCNIGEVLLLHQADHLGRGGERSFSHIREWFEEKIGRLSVKNGVEPLVKGRHLLELGMKPGPEMGAVLKQAFELQLEGHGFEEILRMIASVETGGQSWRE